MGAGPSISYEDSDRGPVVHVRGELDLVAGDVVVEAVRAVLGARRRPARGEAEVQLDLADVSFIDCVGLSGLLRARLATADGGATLRVSAMSAAVRWLVDLAGLSASLAGTDPAAQA